MDSMKNSAMLNNLIKNFNTLLHCPARFCGIYGGQEITNFIEYIKFYKRIKCVTDEQALQELGFLLTETASMWWLRRKGLFSTWSEALTALENQYSKQRSSYLIYKDIYNFSYNEYQTLEDFINDKYELLHELPDPRPSEKDKLKIIYGLLPNNMQILNNFFNISTLYDLKDYVLQFKQKNNANISMPIKPKEEVNTDWQELDSAINIVNHKDIIEVRPINGLVMSEIKGEEGEYSNNGNQGNFIKMQNNATDEQSEPDIMDQINSIIEESERNCERVCDNLQISSVMSAGEIVSCTKLLESVQANISIPTQNIENQPVRKKNLRCGFCRIRGHTTLTCLKKAKLSQIKKLNMELTAAATGACNDTVVDTNTEECVVKDVNNTQKDVVESNLVKITNRCNFCQKYTHLSDSCPSKYPHKNINTDDENILNASNFSPTTSITLLD